MAHLIACRVLEKKQCCIDYLGHYSVQVADFVAFEIRENLKLLS